LDFKSQEKKEKGKEKRKIIVISKDKVGVAKLEYGVG